MKIVVFDSGIGGLTVLKEALHVLPGEDFIYYADTRNVPYGTKSKEEVKGHIFDAVEYLTKYEIKALVIACNTATSIAVRDLRKKYDFPVIGMEPAVKPAIEISGCNNKRVLVTATPLTLKEEKFQNLVANVDQNHIVDSMPFPELVDFAERLDFDYDKLSALFDRKLSSINLDDYGTVVLGCTHFLLFRKAFKAYLPHHIELIDGNEGTVKYLKKLLEKAGRDIEGAGQVLYDSSSRSDSDKTKFLEVMDMLDRGIV